MAGYKETPRQKMIAMMYLVLTALLALNVSKDVINAFVIVSNSIKKSNENLAKKLQDTYSGFERNYLLNQVKVKPFWDKAKEAKLISAELVKYLENIKYEVISETENIPLDSAKVIALIEIENKENNTIPTNYFLGVSGDGSDGVARVLKEKINNYREILIEFVDPKDLDDVNLGLTTIGPYYDADGKELDWETYYFYNTILVADIAILNKFILDVYNAEYEVVTSLYKSIGKGDFKFDKIEAKVLPKSNFVFLGDYYEVEIIVAAYDTCQSPEVYFMEGISYLPVTDYTQAQLLDNKPGKIKMKFPAMSEGLKRYAGFVRARSSDGTVNDYHFNSEYFVTKPSFTISAKKMNVFYIGVPNPVSISNFGIPSEYLRPAISCGTIGYDYYSKDYIVNVPHGCNEAIITISANINGEYKQLGSKRFRVKRIPVPVATIAGKNSGVVKRELLIVAGALSPQMPEDFDFDHSFVISSFTMTIQRGFKVYNYDSKNSYLTNEMIEQIKRTNRGQNIVFENIIVLDPSGFRRTLSAIVLTIN
ncbi:MAG: gliding motility protein GldM [Bacteroidales bacterium]|nr:gliding motility protein GldM [Bacteroidales bacterium]